MLRMRHLISMQNACNWHFSRLTGHLWQNFPQKLLVLYRQDTFTSLSMECCNLSARCEWIDIVDRYVCMHALISNNLLMEINHIQNSLIYCLVHSFWFLLFDKTFKEETEKILVNVLKIPAENIHRNLHEFNSTLIGCWDNSKIRIHFAYNLLSI